MLADLSTPVSRGGYNFVHKIFGGFGSVPDYLPFCLDNQVVRQQTGSSIWHCGLGVLLNMVEQRYSREVAVYEVCDYDHAFLYTTSPLFKRLGRPINVGHNPIHVKNIPFESKVGGVVN